MILRILNTMIILRRKKFHQYIPDYLSILLVQFHTFENPVFYKDELLACFHQQQ